ncbi:hypothetical protein BXZ70DRAFT_890820 [Cristinia sonorae]|uniref:protein-histidine N-methyltransferase n=1 Tax=Cristinia sonorae TaxID=1940300 RepID=A0A8K0UTI9_9AGAR|nr:hypothetical protein BXZ70DRAFT_890820 [Cristinia sonorae]
MFKFNFDLDSDDIDEEVTALDNPSVPEDSTDKESSGFPQHPKPFDELQLSDLLNKLPSVISYSPLAFSLPDGSIHTFARRDLYDARFQVISQDNQDTSQGENELDFVEAPSDLVSGVYEGGLKTWECSLDLAAYIHGMLARDTKGIRYRRILELGCGTAIPSLHLLHLLFLDTSPSKEGSEIHLQDYNELVFRLVTIPNLILTWYMSPASEAFRKSQPAADEDADSLPPVDPSVSGDLPISPDLIAAFLSSLDDRHIRVRVFIGSWDKFDILATGGKYDLVLTSETIYRMESLPSLVHLLRTACIGEDAGDADSSLAKSTSALTLSPSSDPYTCLVAAKLVYFGVGGGVSEFTNDVERAARGRVETVWEQDSGVKRKIMRIRWSAG